MDCGAISCDEKGITPEQILRRVVRLSADGCPALSIAAVAGLGDCEPFFECGPTGGPSPQMSWRQLFMAMTGFNQNGCLSVKAIVTNGNCSLQNLDFGQLHCTMDYLAFLNPFGDMSYTGYYYVYEYSTDQINWTVFGGNTHEQIVSTLPDYGTTTYFFRVTVRCNSTDSYFREFYSDNTDGAAFRRFIQVEVNGVQQPLLSAADGVNYFCITDTLRFLQPNTDFTVAVSGPVSWSTVDETFAPGTLPPGTYTATFTDVSGGIGNGCTGTKQFTIEILALPVITGDLDICDGETTILDAGAGYDSYEWSTGETTQTITTGVAGDYWCRITKSPYSCTLQSATVTLVIQPPLPPLTFSIKPPGEDCVTAVAGGYEFPSSYVWTLVAVPGFDTYDFGFGPQVSNEQEINGSSLMTVIATLNGCSTQQDVLVTALEVNVSVVEAQLSSSPCCWHFEFNDPNIDVPTLVVHVYDSGGETIYNATPNFDHCAPDSGPFTVLMDTQTTPAGCPLVYLKNFSCS